MKIFLLLLSATATYSVTAQTIPVFPKKDETPKTNNAKRVKTKPAYADNKNTATIKFLCDADAVLYIDAVKKGLLKKDMPLRVSLGKGEYIVKVVGTSNDADHLEWSYTVTETGIEKVEKIALQSIVSKRVDAETAALEEQKKKAAAALEAKNKKETALKLLPPIELIPVEKFAIGKYEVTQLQWKIVMNRNPSGNSGCDNCPVENVSWNDVKEFIEKLNDITGKTYRLPSAEEWEYAARGGSHSLNYTYAGSNDIKSVAWFTEGSESQTHPVGQKRPNELGIYDMTGNVWEWCSDWDDTTQQYRVLRGGGWTSSPSTSRIVFRNSHIPTHSFSDIGVRLAISL